MLNAKQAETPVNELILISALELLYREPVRDKPGEVILAGAMHYCNNEPTRELERNVSNILMMSNE